MHELKTPLTTWTWILQSNLAASQLFWEHFFTGAGERVGLFLLQSRKQIHDSAGSQVQVIKTSVVSCVTYTIRHVWWFYFHFIVFWPVSDLCSCNTGLKTLFRTWTGLNLMTNLYLFCIFCTYLTSKKDTVLQELKETCKIILCKVVKALPWYLDTRTKHVFR